MIAGLDGYLVSEIAALLLMFVVSGLLLWTAWGDYRAAKEDERYFQPRAVQSVMQPTPAAHVCMCCGTVVRAGKLPEVLTICTACANPWKEAA